MLLFFAGSSYIQLKNQHFNPVRTDIEIKFREEIKHRTEVKVAKKFRLEFKHFCAGSC
jgi:hypothetical protein